jgi:hypothetical protein
MGAKDKADRSIVYRPSIVEGWDESGAGQVSWEIPYFLV